jgi:RNA binding exosome subunit
MKHRSKMRPLHKRTRNLLKRNETKLVLRQIKPQIKEMTLIVQVPMQIIHLLTLKLQTKLVVIKIRLKLQTKPVLRQTKLKPQIRTNQVSKPHRIILKTKQAIRHQ